MSYIKPLLVLVAAVAFAAAPFFTPEFGGFDPNLYPVPQENPPAQPAGYAFAIWGLIYVWLIAHGAFGLFARAKDPVWDAGRLPLIASLAIGVFWLQVAMVSPIWATVMIWAMLGLALVALMRTPIKDRWILLPPIALYAGWLTAASSVSIALVGAGFGLAFGEVIWALITLGIALILGGGIQSRLARGPEYGAAIVWALIAVVMANKGGSTLVMTAAGVGTALIAALAFRAFWHERAAP